MFHRAINRLLAVRQLAGAHEVEAERHASDCALPAAECRAEFETQRQRNGRDAREPEVEPSAKPGDESRVDRQACRRAGSHDAVEPKLERRLGVADAERRPDFHEHRRRVWILVVDDPDEAGRRAGAAANATLLAARAECKLQSAFAAARALARERGERPVDVRAACQRLVCLAFRARRLRRDSRNRAFERDDAGVQIDRHAREPHELLVVGLRQALERQHVVVQPLDVGAVDVGRPLQLLDAAVDGRGLSLDGLEILERDLELRPVGRAAIDGERRACGLHLLLAILNGLHDRRREAAFAREPPRERDRSREREKQRERCREHQLACGLCGRRELVEHDDPSLGFVRVAPER